MAGLQKQINELTEQLRQKAFLRDRAEDEGTRNALAAECKNIEQALMVLKDELYRVQTKPNDYGLPPK